MPVCTYCLVFHLFVCFFYSTMLFICLSTQTKYRTRFFFWFPSPPSSFTKFHSSSTALLFENAGVCLFNSRIGIHTLITFMMKWKTHPAEKLFIIYNGTETHGVVVCVLYCIERRKMWRRQQNRRAFISMMVARSFSFSPAEAIYLRKKLFLIFFLCYSLSLSLIVLAWFNLVQSVWANAYPHWHMQQRKKFTMQNQHQLRINYSAKAKQRNQIPPNAH